MEDLFVAVVFVMILLLAISAWAVLVVFVADCVTSIISKAKKKRELRRDMIGKPKE